MKRRLLALLALAFVAFVAQASCVSVLGVDDEDLHDVFKDMCACSELQDLGDCKNTLARRYDSAGSATRAAWLARYVERECDRCENVLTCLSSTPTCSVKKCSRAEECCQVGKTQATCDANHDCVR